MNVWGEPDRDHTGPAADVSAPGMRTWDDATDSLVSDVSEVSVVSEIVCIYRASARVMHIAIKERAVQIPERSLTSRARTEATAVW